MNTSKDDLKCPLCGRQTFSCLSGPAYRLGTNGFLVKPSEAHKLVDIAKAINDFWLTHNTLPQTPYGKHAPARVDYEFTV
jgi:hypothetical protein